MKYINGARLDDRALRVDWDEGFRDGRQWGRGHSGGQVRDEFRTDYDPGRGGYGYTTKIAQLNDEKRKSTGNEPGLEKKFRKSEDDDDYRRKTSRFKDEIKEEYDD